MGAETRNQLVRQVYLIKGTRWVSNGEAGNYAFPDWQLVKTDTLCKPEYMNFNWSIGKMKYNDFLVAARLQNGNMLLMRMGLNKEPKQVTPLEFSAIRFLPNFPYMLVEVTKNQETYYVDFNGKEYKKLTK
ncbi:MAG: hypothetical protein IPP72_00025 [Chitinophagaceae bacterium]|nr:hypothetical protein [Chitinophagaceae bacterium]